MGKIDIRAGSKTKVFDSATAPELALAIHDPAFASRGTIGVEIEFIAFEHGQLSPRRQDRGSRPPGLRAGRNDDRSLGGLLGLALGGERRGCQQEREGGEYGYRSHGSLLCEWPARRRLRQAGQS